MSAWLEQLVTWSVTVYTKKDQKASELLLDFLGKPIRFGDKFPESPKLPIGNEGGGLYMLNTTGSNRLGDTRRTGYIVTFYQSLRDNIYWGNRNEIIEWGNPNRLYEQWVQSLYDSEFITDSVIGWYKTSEYKTFLLNSTTGTVKWIEVG